MSKNKKKNYSIDAYQNFLKGILVDKKINEEICDKVNLFSKEGKINFDGNNLFGKIIQRKGNEYLEVRYENEYLVCNYTKWYGKNIVNITQIPLKNGNVKIDRKEKTEYVCYDDKNETNISELEKIYDCENNLIYESTLETEHSYDSLKSSLIYKNDCWWTNNFELEKKWYIPNGSIIKYKLSKNYMDSNPKISEKYSICSGPVRVYPGICYHFIDLDEELFKSFMSGEITIEKLLKQNKKTKDTMKKVK